jgi:hypothetical protein
MQYSIWVIIFLFLTACGPTQLATLPPSPQPIHAVFPPSLAPISDALHSCANYNPEIAVVVSESPTSPSDIGPDRLTLWLGEKPDIESYAIPLAQDELIIIVNQANPIEEMSLEQIRALFEGQIENWSDLTDFQHPVEIWTYSESNLLHQIFQSELFDGLRFSLLAQIAPTAESMVSAVANDPGALGYVVRSWITDGVTSIQIESDSDLALQQPILALTNTEPQGGLRALMACLQSGIGQSTLLERYSPMK